MCDWSNWRTELVRMRALLFAAAPVQFGHAHAWTTLNVSRRLMHGIKPCVSIKNIFVSGLKDNWLVFNPLNPFDSLIKKWILFLQFYFGFSKRIPLSSSAIRNKCIWLVLWFISELFSYVTFYVTMQTFTCDCVRLRKSGSGCLNDLFSSGDFWESLTGVKRRHQVQQRKPIAWFWPESLQSYTAFM